MYNCLPPARRWPRSARCAGCNRRCRSQISLTAHRSRTADALAGAIGRLIGKRDQAIIGAASRRKDRSNENVQANSIGRPVPRSAGGSPGKRGVEFDVPHRCRSTKSFFCFGSVADGGITRCSSATPSRVDSIHCCRYLERAMISNVSLIPGEQIVSPATSFGCSTQCRPRSLRVRHQGAEQSANRASDL